MECLAPSFYLLFCWPEAICAAGLHSRSKTTLRHLPCSGTHAGLYLQMLVDSSSTSLVGNIHIYHLLSSFCDSVSILGMADLPVFSLKGLRAQILLRITGSVSCYSSGTPLFDLERLFFVFI